MTEFIEVLGDPKAVATVGTDEEYVEVSIQSDAISAAIDAQDFIEILEYAPGSSGGGGSFVFTQSTPAASWTITHNLGTAPAVVLLLDSAPTSPVWADTEYTDLNTVVISLPSAESGKAYLR